MMVFNLISTFAMYEKEESGIKPNTIRELSPLREAMLLMATHVRIRRGYTDKSFLRKITDKTKWNGIWIVSWNPNEAT